MNEFREIVVKGGISKNININNICTIDSYGLLTRIIMTNQEVHIVDSSIEEVMDTIKRNPINKYESFNKLSQDKATKKGNRK